MIAAAPVKASSVGVDVVSFVCETFTNEKMLEIESLGPLTSLRPGQSVEHRERWELYDAAGIDFRQSNDESLDAFIRSVQPAEFTPS